jgi:hypothetical protein
MDILVGYTGFVGSNLYSQHKFNRVFNSKNIAEAIGSNPDLCIYAGVRAEKFTADRFPEEDLSHINETLKNIQNINPKELVLISTVDVIPSQQNKNVYEDTQYDTDRLTPYGQNRLCLENEVRELYPATLVVRLPALFGEGLKKNFIYDMINYIPAMLKKEKFEELYAKASQLSNFYKEDENGFFRLITNISGNDRAMLKVSFENIGFSALNFTDSRSKFSFYNLKYLWGHIEILLDNEIKLAHMATEPVSADEIYRAVYGRDFINGTMSRPFDYTFFKTRYAKLFYGGKGYVFDKNRVISEVVSFINNKFERLSD